MDKEPDKASPPDIKASPPDITSMRDNMALLIWGLWKDFQFKSLTNSWRDRMFCGTRMVCTTRSGRIWWLKWHSWSLRKVLLGIIESTNKPKTLQIWAKSQHAYKHVLTEFSKIRDKEKVSVTSHKKEGERWINQIWLIGSFSTTCIDPQDLSTHDQSSLVTTGEHGGDKTIMWTKQKILTIR